MSSEALIFLKRFLDSPGTIGSLAPSSKYLGKAICEAVKSLDDCKLVEVGAGTGSITKEIAELNPEVIEIDSEFTELLKNKFPKLKIENRCAIDYMRSLVTQDKGEKVGLVLSIPLINNPFRETFIHELQQFYSSGLLSWCIIYTYGKKSPLSEIDFRCQRKFTKVFRNLPPANVWIYQ